ncbi:MAG: hypothetical protein MI974_06840 [Chitinophagales bacterium]|nr:hypothetical protein [Chitinophagales bacterium]
MIKVTNNGSKTIYVGINSWGKGSSKQHPIKKAKSESWDREDERRFVMAITLKKGDKNVPFTYYFVKVGEYTIESFSVT